MPQLTVNGTSKLAEVQSLLDFLPRRVQPQPYRCILVLIVFGNVLVSDLSAIWSIPVLPTACLRTPNRAGDRGGRWGGGDPLLSTPPPRATTLLTRSLPLGRLNRPHRLPPLSVPSGPPDRLHCLHPMVPALTLPAPPGCPLHPRPLLGLRRGAFALQCPLSPWDLLCRPQRLQCSIRLR